MNPSKECAEYIRPVRDVLDIINGKWKLPILIALSFGHKRFKELERDVEGITPKMLSKELRDLELNQLVTRTVYDTIPVTVEYTLTEYGKSLDDVIVALRTWGKKHRSKLFNQVQESGTEPACEEGALSGKMEGRNTSMTGNILQ